MDPSDVMQFIILVVLVLLSAFFSGSETALTTTNKLRMKALADDNVTAANKFLKLIEEPSKTLSAILIGNNVVNMSASALTTTIVIRMFGNKWVGIGTGLVTLWVGIGTGLVTLIILIFSEIIPKTMSTIHADQIALKVAGPIYFITKLLTPVIFLINKLSLLIMKLLRIDPNAKAASMTETELRTILDFSHEEGVIESEEREMLNNIVDFGDSVAKDVMVPRIDMDFVSVDLDYDQLMEEFDDNKHTRMPVYSETRDNIIGIVNLKDVVFFEDNKENFSLIDILRKPYFTYEFKKTSELLIEMRSQSIPLAIVLDEYGATAGLLTIEDLLEEIVGEIHDEYDSDEEEPIQLVGEHEYLVNGNTKIYDINDALGLNLESSDYDSIAGHIIFLLDRLPEGGETITEDNVVYTVKSVIRNRVDKIHIIINEAEEYDIDESIDEDIGIERVN